MYSNSSDASYINVPRGSRQPFQARFIPVPVLGADAATADDARINKVRLEQTRRNTDALEEMSVYTISFTNSQEDTLP